MLYEVITDKLSGDVVNKINVVATRKLPVITDSGFSVGTDGYLNLQPSTSIIDSICYMVTAENGGRMPESFLKWDTLFFLNRNNFV